MNFRRIALISCAALLLLAGYLAWHWQPERQIREHTRQLLKAVERRKWDSMRTLLAENYSDRWGHDKEFVLKGCEQVFAQFLFLKVEHEVTAVDLATGCATTRVKMSGQGGPAAQFVMSTVNGLPEPFRFFWEQRSGKPWDWHLVKVEQPTLEVARQFEF
ncbi:MAG TPA: hypothetical protein VGO90_05050 [Chthoniobacteraceae bacterium]|jgi:hypothetical protein|nr:hypothetical protein [Chthoniobacter sp.]HEV7867025.1 hypothetical protein [Chthoniobacteraceae bacterium]